MADLGRPFNANPLKNQVSLRLGLNVALTFLETIADIVIHISLGLPIELTDLWIMNSKCPKEMGNLLYQAICPRSGALYRESHFPESGKKWLIAFGVL